MRLKILSEATLKDIERRLPIFIKKYYRDTPSEQNTSEIEKLASLDPSKGKYTEWVIRQYKSSKIRIPEDNNKITQLLKKFHQNKRQLGNKDINNYTPGDLARALDEVGVSKRKAKKKGRAGELTLPPGAELVLDKGNIQIVKVTDPKASSILCSGTEWCTANESTAKDYLQDGPLYLIYRGGERYALAHADSEQLLDVYDAEFRVSENIALLKILYSIDKDFGFILAAESGTRILEYEPSIMKDPRRAYIYARDIIEGRWPEAEPYIMKDTEFAHRYARDIIKDRWPEAEPYIMKDPEFAYYYADGVIKGRWPEAEPYVVKNPESAYRYTRDVIGDRWPEAEPYIMKDPKWAYIYAKDVIKGRWFDAEPYIMKDPEYSDLYTVVFRGP